MRAESLPSSERITAELRRRLEEAEETIRAIREGEVDALVMRNPRDEDEVFTLEGGTESYRAFMEAMDVGAAAFDGSSHLIYANKALLNLLDLQRETPTSDIFEALPSIAREIVKDLVNAARSEKSAREIVLPGQDGERHVLVSASPFTLGINDGIAVTFADITARVHAMAARESERAAHAIIASANEAVIVCDLNGVITHANAAVAGITAASPIGMHFNDAVPIVVPDSSGLMQGPDLVELAIGGTSVQGIEASAPKAPRIKDLLISAAPLRLGDRLTGCVVTMVDLSQRKAAEKQQLLLMGELDHRVKNTLALVLSIAKRTSSTEGTVEGFQKAFANRIQALAATHNILADRSWNAVTIAEILRTELEPFVNDIQTRLLISGEETNVNPRAAISFGMVIHELATNAVKYGALSSAGGKVAVNIEKSATGGLSVKWKESGGPEVHEPTASGFGQTVITRSMQYAEDGGAAIHYDPDGVRCLISIPAADIVH
jgi:two-component sensor histidine kinase